MKTTKFIVLSLTALVTLSVCGCSHQEESGNAVIEAIMSRRSIRKYLDKAVPRELLEEIAVCGINAPNAVNGQEWEVRIVDSPEYIDDVTKLFISKYPEAASRNTYFKNIFRNAPAIICVAAKPGRWAGVNTGLMGENMMLAAWSLGLGTCCLGGPVDFLTTDESARPLYEALGFSEGYELQYVLAVGYPDETPSPKPRDKGKIRFVEFGATQI